MNDIIKVIQALEDSNLLLKLEELVLEIRKEKES